MSLEISHAINGRSVRNAGIGFDLFRIDSEQILGVAFQILVRVFVEAGNASAFLGNLGLKLTDGIVVLERNAPWV